MSKKWLRIIAVLEIVGGNVGILVLFWQLASLSTNAFALLLGLLVFAIHLLSIVAGVALWRERPFGRLGSLIVQAIQLPKLTSPALVFAFSFGVDFYPYIMFAEGFSKVGVDLKLLGHHQLFINAAGAPLAPGVSLPAAFFFTKLARYKPTGGDDGGAREGITGAEAVVGTESSRNSAT